MMRIAMIEKNVPVPALVSLGPKKYPFSDMDVGDSFFWKYEKGKAKKSIRNAAYMHGKRYGKTFVSRSEPSGVRVWRTE